jgi:hypothetical protein
MQWCSEVASQGVRPRLHPHAESSWVVGVDSDLPHLRFTLYTSRQVPSGSLEGLELTLAVRGLPGEQHRQACGVGLLSVPGRRLP